MSIGAKISEAHRRLVKLSEEQPEWVELAREAIRPWENKEELLLGAVAIALREAYERGKAGKYPVCNQLQEDERPRKLVMRRPVYRKADPAPEPTPSVRRLRRR